MVFIIILSHTYNEGVNCLLTYYGGRCLGWVTMWLFFAMSGYGLVHSVIRNPDYIKGFVPRSLTKLFVPYLLIFPCYLLYRVLHNIPIVFYNSVIYPTSWFIWCLALFYVFFALVFSYSQRPVYVNVLLVSLLVIAYIACAHILHLWWWPRHRYMVCPGFCIGMFFALFDKYFKKRMLVWQALIFLLILVFVVRNYVYSYSNNLSFASDIISCFLLMYIAPNFKANKLTSFVSSISL